MKKLWNAFIWYLHGYNFSWGIKANLSEGTSLIMDYPSEHHARKVFDSFVKTPVVPANCLYLLHCGSVVETRDLTTEHQ